MSVRATKYAVVVLALWGLSANRASAQDFTLTLFGGYMHAGELTLENVRSSLQGTGVVGARFEFDLARIVGFEQTVAYMPDFAAADTFQSIRGGSGFIYNGNLVLNAPIGHFVPYATAGVGLVHSGRIYNVLQGEPAFQEDFGTRFAVNYGGGLKFMNLAGPFGIRLDVRGYTLPNAFSNTLNFVEASGGIMFSF